MAGLGSIGDERFRRLAEAGPDIVYSYRFAPDQGFEYLSPAVTAITGYTPEELCGNAELVRTLVHPEDWALFTKVPEDGTPVITVARWLARDGRTLWIELHDVPVTDGRGTVVAVQGVARDITSLRRAEDALSGSEDRLRVALDSARMLVWEWSLDTGEMIFGGDTKLFGVSRPPRTFPEMLELVHPDDRGGLQEAIQGLLGGERGEHEMRVIGDDGVERWVAARGRILLDETKRPATMVGTGFDITDRRRAEEALRSTDEALQAIVRSTPVAIVTVDRDLIVTDWNRAAERMFGWRAAEVVGRPLPHIPADELEAARGLIGEVFGGRSLTIPEARRVTKDGTVKEVMLSLAPLRDAAGGVVGILATLTDVSEQVAARRRLHESVEVLQRLDSDRRLLLGHLVRAQEEERQRIAADIHDDSVQVLTALSLRLQLLKRKLDDPELLSAVDEAELAARTSLERLRHLIFELRPPALDRDGLLTALRLYLEQMRIATGIVFALEGSPAEEPSPETRAILYRIAQEALTNVAKHSGAANVRVTVQSAGDGIEVWIADDGRGFDLVPEERPEPGHLGLVAMRERAELAGGWFRIQAAVGRGTTVEFFVPDLASGERPR